MIMKLHRIGSDKNDPKLLLSDIATQPIGILTRDVFDANVKRFLNKNDKKKESNNGRKKHI